MTTTSYLSDAVNAPRNIGNRVVFCTPWANTRKVGSRDRGAVELPGVRQRADDETPRTTTPAS
jgi:hypothetical protein